MTFGADRGSAPRWSSSSPSRCPPLLMRGAAHRLVGARAGAAAGARRPRRRLPGPRRHRAQRLDARRARAPAAPGGCCWPSRSLGHDLLLGVAGLPRRPRFDGAASIAAERGRAPLVTSGAPLLLLLWAAAAVVDAVARARPLAGRGRRRRHGVVGRPGGRDRLARRRRDRRRPARPGCGSARWRASLAVAMEMGPRHDRGT